MLKTFCLFVLHQKFQFGVVKNRGKRWQVQGLVKIYNLTKRSIFFCWQAELEKSEHIYLAKKIGEAKDFFTDLTTIYEICELREKYSLANLASLVFGEQKNDWHKALLCFYLLKQGQGFFSYQNGFFEKKNESEKDLWIAKKQQEQLRLKKISLENHWAKILLKGQKLECKEGELELWNDFCGRLSAFSQNPSKHSEKEYFQNLFSLQKEKKEFSFLTALKFLQIDITWQDWQAKKIDICEQYSNEVLNEAETLAKNYTSFFTSDILDETHLVCYSVDSSKTKDFDDAISIEKITDGYTVRVHISNVAFFIKNNSYIFQHLERYISSCYTLDKIYHLMPDIMSCNVFSLLQGEVRIVMSFSFVFDNHYQLLDTKIYFSKICVQKNISYQLVDEWITQKPEWQFLAKVCDLFLQKRIKDGALHFERQEAQLDISDPEDICISMVNTSSPAYLVVSELAIQVNFIAAQKFIQNKCRAIFRKQAPYKLLAPDVSKQEAQLEHFDIAPAYYSVQADTHYGLGIKVYSQITSPIRRFSDLLGQKILSAIIKNETIPFQDNYLLDNLQRLQNKTNQYIQLERKISNYWKIKYLEQNKELVFIIKLLKNNNAQVVFFLKEQLVYHVICSPLEMGKLYQAKIKKIYWQERIIFLNIL